MMCARVLPQKLYIETKASPRRQCSTGRILCDIATRTHADYVDGVNNYLNSNLTNIWHNSAADFFLRFGKYLPQICESCGATYRRNYELFSAL